MFLFDQIKGDTVRRRPTERTVFNEYLQRLDLYCSIPTMLFIEDQFFARIKASSLIRSNYKSVTDQMLTMLLRSI